MKKLALPLFLLLNAPVHAEDLTPRTAKTFLSDGGDVVAAPFRIKRENFKWAAAAIIVTAGSSLLDRTGRDHFFSSRNTNGAKDWRFFGDAIQVLGPAVGTGFLLAGAAHDDDKSTETGYLVYECFIWSAVIEGGVNYLVGRQRPLTTDDPYSFRPFHVDTSFPSGHTTQAFAAATVFAEQYPHWYVEVPVYSAAALTAFSRMYASKHWTSDVVGGAMLGMFTAHTIRLHRRRRDKKTESGWDFSTHGNDLRLAYHF